MKNIDRLTFLMTIVFLIQRGICFSQEPPVKSLKQGNAFLYSYESYAHGGYYHTSKYTDVVLYDTTIGEMQFYKLAGGSLEYSDSTKLVRFVKGANQVICDFQWSIGDSINIAGVPWRVTNKGVDRIFSDSLPFITLGGSYSTSRTIFKKFGIVGDYFDNIINWSYSRLIGAKLDDVIYGDPPTSVTVNRESDTESSLNVFPNPTFRDVNIQINTQQSSQLKIEVFNILGQRVALLYQGRITPGRNTYMWNGRNKGGQILPSGVYLVRVRLGEKIIQGRVLRLR